VHPELERRIAAVAALDQPLRRELYGLLLDSGWMTRDEAAAALGIPRSVASFHLDKLAAAGVLEVRFERTSGRRGPGAGRPSKLYRPIPEDIAASVPDRRYDLAGSVLATAVADATRTGTAVAECLHAAAHDAGQAIGEVVHDGGRAALVAVLGSHGYAPVSDGEEITLTNCPFHRLAEEHRDLVCSMNLDLVDGVLEGMGSPAGLTARLEPVPGACCVRIASATIR
jgi:predicted ArsR family transcriptional regulator